MQPEVLDPHRMDSAREVVKASLAEVLAARDRRVEWQKYLLERDGASVLSLTLVSPGSVKDSPERRRLMDRMEAVMAEALGSAGLRVRTRLRFDGVTGPEAVWSVESTAEALKRLVMRVETEKPWGRLLDADVIFSGGNGDPAALSRTNLGGETRRCLVCEEDAGACIRLRRHDPRTVEELAERLIQQFAESP
jgi:holo-ACP synthase